VGRASALKEAATQLWTYRYRGWALKYFKHWYYWATHSQLKPMIRVAKTMKRYLPRILNYLRSQTTNAGAEAINAKIQEVKYRARSFRNRGNFRRAILILLWQPRYEPTLTPEEPHLLGWDRIGL
jgi:transposase